MNCGIMGTDFNKMIPRVACDNRGNGQPVMEVNNGYFSTVSESGERGFRPMGTIKFIPKNEMQTREWFAFHLREFDYSIVKSGRPFPDYVLENKEGILLDVEIEYRSSNFVAHRHDPNNCDMIVCWVHDLGMPLPVLELSTRKYYNAGATADNKHQDSGAKNPSQSALEGRVSKNMKYAKLTPSVIALCKSEIVVFRKALIEHSLWLTESELARRKLVKKTRADLVMSPYMKLLAAIRKNGGGSAIDTLGVMTPDEVSKLIDGKRVFIDGRQ